MKTKLASGLRPSCYYFACKWSEYACMHVCFLPACCSVERCVDSTNAVKNKHTQLSITSCPYILITSSLKNLKYQFNILYVTWSSVKHCIETSLKKGNYNECCWNYIWGKMEEKKNAHHLVQVRHADLVFIHHLKVLPGHQVQTQVSVWGGHKHRANYQGADVELDHSVITVFIIRPYQVNRIQNALIIGIFILFSQMCICASRFENNTDKYMP